MTDKKKPAAPENVTEEKLYIDPDTGDILQGEIADKQADNLKAAFRNALQGGIADKQADSLTSAFKALLLLDEISDLEPYIKRELENNEYAGKTFNDLKQYTAGELLELMNDPNSYISKVIEAARAAKTKKDRQIMEQQAGRDKRRQLKSTAEKNGAIMELRGGQLPVFSSDELWKAFAPERIAKIGALPPEKIDATGQVDLYGLKDGDILPLSAPDINFAAYMLLNAIMANSVENYQKETIPDGSVTFYVKGVLDSINVDARIKKDGQLNMDRKTAGVLYLEKEIEPLLKYIGTTPNGSRYSVLNYEGYNADADTMTIRSPYLSALWKITQGAYENRLTDKTIKKGHLTPLEVNFLFKKAAYNEDDTVLEIAVYITNTLLKAGKKKEVTTTEINYRTLISNCPRLKSKLEEIEARPKVLANGKKQNITANYNTELRKIARAYKLIMDTEKCDALKLFDFVAFRPSKVVNGKPEFIPPTKSLMKGKIVIKWRRID